MPSSIPQTLMEWGPGTCVFNKPPGGSESHQDLLEEESNLRKDKDRKDGVVVAPVWEDGDPLCVGGR